MRNVHAYEHINVYRTLHLYIINYNNITHTHNNAAVDKVEYTGTPLYYYNQHDIFEMRARAYCDPGANTFSISHRCGQHR